MTTQKKKSPPTGNITFLQQLVRNTFATLANAPKNYPEMLVTGIPGKRIYLINHPDLAQHVLQKNYPNYNKGKAYEVLTLLLGNGLVNNDGENWHKQRMLIQPAFHMESLKRISEIVTSSTNRLLRRWKTKENTTINFTREMAEVTIEIVAQSLFTTDITTAHIETIWRDINFLRESADRMLRNPLSIPWIVPTPQHLKMRKYMAELNDLFFGIIEKRKREKNPPHDLLQLLLDARYEKTGPGMSNQQIRDELMTIFIAGHETTVNVLSWTWYLLKRHKDEESKLREEALNFAAERDPIFEDIPGLVYGKQVINESMRMYPPGIGVTRTAQHADEIGGYYVPSGAKVAVNIAGLHHHPNYWLSPFEFRPQRFEKFDLKRENRFVFLPFSEGPRICIGKNFAMMEMQLINTILSARVDMQMVSQNLKAKALFTLKPESDVMMRLKKVNIKQ